MNRTRTDGIVIHHTVTANNISPENLRAIFKSRFGVSYIGYNFVILADGSRYSDIGADGFGIHSNTGAFQNYNSVGIALAGNFENEQPTAKALVTLSNTIKEMLKKYNLKESNVVGHRDTAATACPGKNLYSLKPWIKGETMPLLNVEQQKEVYRTYLDREPDQSELIQAGRDELQMLRDCKTEIVANYKTWKARVKKLEDEQVKLQDQVKELSVKVNELEKQVAECSGSSEKEVVENWLVKLWNRLFK